MLSELNTWIGLYLPFSTNAPSLRLHQLSSSSSDWSKRAAIISFSICPVNPAHPFRTFISHRLVAGAKRAADVDSSSPASHGPIRPIRDSLVTQSISLDILSSQKNCARVFIFPDAVIHAPQLPWSSCCSRNHRGAYVGFVKETQNHLDWHGM